jgi:predicted nicotinamide N-methyase
MFKFNFDKENPNGGASSSSAPAATNEKSFPDAVEHVMDESHLCQIGDDGIDINSHQVGDFGDIMYLDSKSVVDNLVKKKPDLAISRAVSSNNDVVAGEYEGGMKLWECATDLVSYLNRTFKEKNLLKDKHVLELGCGAGLPGLYCLLRGSNVDFQDFNAEVIDHITIPNVLLNAPNVDDDAAAESRFLSGDWLPVETMLLAQKRKYDLILTSETIYNTANHKKLISLFDSCLEKNGQILLAAKSVYFGVGGSINLFQEELDKTNCWDWKSVDVIASSVQREILLITRKSL